MTFGVALEQGSNNKRGNTRASQNGLYHLKKVILNTLYQIQLKYGFTGTNFTKNIDTSKRKAK